MNLKELIDGIVETNKENVDSCIEENQEITELENLIFENLDLMDVVADVPEGAEKSGKTLREMFTEFSILLQDEAYKKGIEDGIKIKKMLS
jgi:hypothetical protein